jgi:hypothetical protein
MGLHHQTINLDLQSVLLAEESKKALDPQIFPIAEGLTPLKLEEEQHQSLSGVHPLIGSRETGRELFLLAGRIEHSASQATSKDETR